MESTTNKWIYEHSEKNWGENQNAPLQQCEQEVLEKYVRDKNGRILEGACGGGRISNHLYQWGFQNIDAFDFVDSFVQSAKVSNPSINFFCADARDLHMLPSNHYDYVIYLQQCICFIPVDGIDNALRENFRVCGKGGTAIFSFLNYNGRRVNRYLSVFLSVLRCLRNEDLSEHQLPWLRLNGNLNYNFWRKGQATNYWFTKSQIIDRLEAVGYKIVDLFTMSEDINSEGMIFVVCKKP